MPISTRDFAELTDELQTVYNEASNNAIGEAMGLTIFNVGETNLLNFEHQILHGVKGIEQIPEGADLPRVNSEEGDNITYVQQQYGAIVAITKKMRKFELTNQMTSLINTIVDDAWNKIDQSLADVLLRGYSTSYTDVYGKTVSGVGPDGLATFSTAHTNGTTGTTFSNVINDGTNNNPLFARTAMVAEIKNAKTYKDPNGLLRPIRLDTVLVNPTNEDSAVRELNTDNVAGFSNFDSNKHIQQTVKNLKVWERLETNGAGTDTPLFWFMYDSRKVGESLKLLFSERPTLDAPEVVYNNKNWDYSIDYFYTIGRGFPAYIRGSNGTVA